MSAISIIVFYSENDSIILYLFLNESVCGDDIDEVGTTHTHTHTVDDTVVLTRGEGYIPSAFMCVYCEIYTLF